MMIVIVDDVCDCQRLRLLMMFAIVVDGDAHTHTYTYELRPFLSVLFRLCLMSYYMICTR